MRQLTEEIKWLCREYGECCAEAERREEGGKVRQELKRLWQEVRGKLDIAEPEELVALMDAYEVTRDEGMLQEVLDVVSGNIDRLEVSAEAVKLLAYCYYYVEEDACAVKAREMLACLRGMEGRKRELAEAERIVEELI